MRAEHDPDREQVNTVSVMIGDIMSSRAFALGLADVRAGRPPRQEVDTWTDTNWQWSYERGRQFGVLAPRRMPLTIDGELNPAAVVLYARLGNDIP